MGLFRGIFSRCFTSECRVPLEFVFLVGINFLHCFQHIVYKYQIETMPVLFDKDSVQLDLFELTF